MSTIQAKIEKATLNARKKLFDLNIHLLGQEVSLARFKIEADMYGDENLHLISNDVIEAIISFSTDEIPMSRIRPELSTDDSVETDSVYLFDILPTELFCKWQDDVTKGDILVQVFMDGDVKVPILWKVSEIIGSFKSSLLWRKFYIAPFNGIIPDDIKLLIDEYVDSFEIVI